MSLNRRIVLDDSEICSPEPVKVQKPPAIVPPLGVGSALHWMPGNSDATTFADALGLYDEVIKCKSCGYDGPFDGNHRAQTIQCLGCGRVSSFEAFKKEHT
jgi:hypothetical protein